MKFNLNHVIIKKTKITSIICNWNVFHASNIHKQEEKNEWRFTSHY